jgi:hypothetical protein
VKKGILAIFVLALCIGIAPSLRAGSKPAGAASPAGGKMPQKVVLGSISRQYEPVQFNHASHVSNAGGCADCHHQHGHEASVSCVECHAIDSSAFKKSVKLAKLRPCRECHAPAHLSDNPGRPSLQVAYHRACFKCHRGDVGSVGKDPKGCVEMCHSPKAQAKLDRKP